ncbi:RNA ligase 1 isoform X2 [Ambystoma mexicanum]|uniref:RNA ligase 1 isoform X2 n=1 Tax=Ambystoma mexicanum TaxID=8296 RepID=UPI0037E7A507
MQRLCSVQQKISCVFVTEVKDESSLKRENQPFRVLAMESINPKVCEADLHNAIPTEKVDGTCCYVAPYKGQPYLWARLDRKPNKQAEKRFKKCVHSKQEKDFVWNVEDDFKPVPDNWIPAKEIHQCNGSPLPDEAGHIPGWVPVEKGNKQYCWHSSVINYEAGVALVLRPQAEDTDISEVSLVQLCDLLEQTLELIGTNINSNPYGLGSKKYPVHFLVPHGIFPIKNLPKLRHSDLLSWFESCKEARIEGIVWHCKNGGLVKLHRHHLGLIWPLPETHLGSQPAVINVDLAKYECDFQPKSLFAVLSCMLGQRMEKLKDIILDGV